MAIDSIIPSNILFGSRLFTAIEQAASDPSVLTAIEIGGGIGDGATAAILRAFINKPQLNLKFVSIELSKEKYQLLASSLVNYSFAEAINGNSVSSAAYPTRADLKAFYWDQVTDFRKTDLDESIRRKEAEVAYISARGSALTDEALTAAIALTSTVDLIVINGSDFTGELEYEIVDAYAPKYYVLIDTNNIKNYSNKAAIEAGDYSLFRSGKDNGIDWHIYKTTL
jgi:hypothetical protein